MRSDAGRAQIKTLEVTVLLRLGRKGKTIKGFKQRGGNDMIKLPFCFSKLLWKKILFIEMCQNHK